VLYQDHRDAGFVPVGVATGGLGGGETEETLQDFVEQTGVTFDIAWDSSTYYDYDWPPAVSPYPRQALVGRDGLIRYMAAEHQAGALEAAIEAALAEGG
jgi:hypothetical protein